MGGISVVVKLVYSIDLAEKTGQFNYFDEKLRVISSNLFRSELVETLVVTIQYESDQLSHGIEIWVGGETGECGQG